MLMYLKIMLHCYYCVMKYSSKFVKKMGLYLPTISKSTRGSDAFSHNPPSRANHNMGLVVRKPVCGVSDKASFKPVSSATETS